MIIGTPKGTATNGINDCIMTLFLSHARGSHGVLLLLDVVCGDHTCKSRDVGLLLRSALDGGDRSG
jgi:hypothetical protein